MPTSPLPVPATGTPSASRFRTTLLLAVIALMVLATACASDPDPRIEDFPTLLFGTWEQIGGPEGTLTFEGSTASGVGRLSADGIAAETFTYQWVAPSVIRTNLGEDIEFVVQFEDTGGTLVLSTVPAAPQDEIIRYSRRK